MTRGCVVAALALVLALGCGAAARAHRGSESRLTLDASAAPISGRWELELRDAAPVPADAAAAAAWLAAHPEAGGALLRRLQLTADGVPCALQVQGHAIATRAAGPVLVLQWRAQCPAAPHALSIDYSAAFAADAQHQGLLTLHAPDRPPRWAVFTAQSPRQVFALREPGRWARAGADLRSGLWHIWSGFDHLLFLLCLLLPVVVRPVVRPAPSALPAPSRPAPRAVAVEVLRVVSAFTLAHSLTLALAALQVWAPPARVSESVIALSVLVAALLNLRRPGPARRWQAAFGFGLVHGFGFAAALADVGASGTALAATLAAFNVGVELGQLAVVGAVLPLAWWLARRRWYEPVVLRGGSAGAGALALAWFVERAFDVALLRLP